MKSYYKRPRRRKGKIAVLLILIVLVAVAAAVAVVAYQRVKTIETVKPEELFSSYIEDLQKQDYEGMYNRLSEESKHAMSKDVFVKRNQNIYEGIEMSNLTVSNVRASEPENKSVTVYYQMSMDTVAGTMTFENQAVYISDKEKGYALSWSDELILPELTSTDKVRVSTAKAERGEIVDRNGKKLAQKGQASSVGLIPGKMGKDKEGDIKKLAKLLEVSEETIQKKLSATWVKEDSFVPIKTIKKVDELELASANPSEETLKAKELEDNLLAIDGIMINTVDTRIYPMAEKAAHLVGYVQNITAEELKENAGKGYTSESLIGKSGAEALYEEQLKGTDGCSIKIVDKDGNTKKIVATKPKMDGETIKLTIDASLQEKLYDEYQKDKSVSVAMNHYTGEVLALVSTPSYDSNDFVLGMSDAKWKELNEDPDKPLYNRFRQVLCPGSTFKPVIAATGLECGAIDPNEDYGNEGNSWQKDKSWGSYKVTTLHTYTPVTMQNAIMYSDNIYFAKAALKIGKDKMSEGLTKIGFTKQLPFEINMAKSQFSNTETFESEIQLADTGYGQGQVLVNPLHLATIYTAFANEGNMIKPYLTYKEDNTPEIYIKNAFSKKNTKLVTEALEKVVNDKRGSARSGKRSDVTLVGKTGTAELKATKEEKDGVELGWFASFTTDKNAKKPILIVSMVEDVKERGGSTYVVTKNGKVLDDYLK